MDPYAVNDINPPDAPRPVLAQAERACALILAALPLALLALAGPLRAATEPGPEDALKLLGLTDAQPTLVMLVERVGYFHKEPPPHGVADPIDPLGSIDPALAGKGLKGKDFKAFVDGYVDRIEQAASAGGAAPEGLLPWLAAHPAIRQEFWLALSPQFNDARAAMQVLDRLRQHNAAAVVQCFQLAIAMAVVYDKPNAIYGSRYATIFGVDASQFGPVPDLLEVFDYFVSPKNQAAFLFKPQQLPWPVLVHLVDLDCSKDDREWAQSHCASSRADVGPLYLQVPYDDDKLAGSGTRLGSQPYTLPNLLSLGGVCGDRSHFTSRVAKCFGIPSMKVAGEGRYGRASAHAWCGYLAVRKGRPILEFTGRFDYDFYYTGEIYDPQTSTMILDRTVEMLYDGLSTSYDKYRDSQLLARAALKLVADKPALSAALARQAIEKDTYNPTAWRVLAWHIAHGALQPKEAATWSNRMLTELAAHPDLTLECLPELMAQLPESKVDQRQALYNAAMQLYAQRPDLQIKLRSAQCAELVSHGRQPQALELMLATVGANAKEGSLILPLVEQIVNTSKDFAASTPNFHLEVVKQELSKVEALFPAKRGNTMSPAFSTLQNLIAKL